MKLYKLFPYFLLIVFIIGCSSSSESTNEMNHPELKSIPTHTTSGNLEIAIPNGWREIKDNYNQLFDIWLVNQHNNAVICFIPIYLSNDLIEKSYNEKLDIITKIVKNKKQNSTENFEIIEEKNEEANYQIKSIKFGIDNSIQNSVLFGNENTFYECLAYFKNEYSPDLTETELLIEIQEQIVTGSYIK